MDVPNFLASFLTFRIDWEKKAGTTASHKPPFTLNNARIQLESRCHILDKETEISTEYVLGASCKAERVGVEKDIWMQPNADFCPVFSRDDFLILKSWDRNDKGVMLHPPSLGVQPERQMGRVVDAYDSLKINIRMNEAEPLGTGADIVQATLAGDLLVGRIEFTAQDRYEVMLDFPIKTMNANERDIVYQTDTGPLIFPDFSADSDRLIETLRLAYVAYNGPDWAEFILQVPTPLTDQISVNHYSKSVRLDTKNSTWRMIN